MHRSACEPASFLPADKHIDPVHFVCIQEQSSIPCQEAVDLLLVLPWNRLGIQKQAAQTSFHPEVLPLKIHCKGRGGAHIEF